MFSFTALRLVSGRNTKSQDPSSKHQAPNTRKAPMLKHKGADITAGIGIWTLEFLWCLDLGAWCFHRANELASRSKSCEIHFRWIGADWVCVRRRLSAPERVGRSGFCSAFSHASSIKFRRLVFNPHCSGI